ncbi:MAG: sialidase family protein [Rikenellaceae bacterium]
MKIKTLALSLAAFTALSLVGCSSAPKTISMDDVTTVTVFNSGTEGVNSFRIPTIATAVDGSLIVAGEARHETWKDKSHTDVYLKRSTDGGVTWSESIDITGAINDGHAFMDPLLIVEKGSGKIWLFATRWVEFNKDVANNRAFVSVSVDNGATWSTPSDITEEIVMPGAFIMGFGPGSGIQIEEGSYASRLIVPTRQAVKASAEDNEDTARSYCVTVYSDDAGDSWKIGEGISPAEECQIAYCGEDNLNLNIRGRGYRYDAFSADGGLTWSKPTRAEGIPGVENGCQASVMSIGGNGVLFCGIQGAEPIGDYDNRCKLTLYRSADGAKTWSESQLLYEAATGYCCMTTLNDGRLAIVMEAGDQSGFTRIPSRPMGWMRLDVMILPREVTDLNCWFEE